jgi:antitoxin component YwqK of YwqJK toxin-antitoxin module
MAHESIVHYPNGAVKEKKFLVDGRLSGEYKTFFPSGQIMAHLHFLRGKRHGSAVS